MSTDLCLINAEEHKAYRFNWLKESRPYYFMFICIKLNIYGPNNNDPEFLRKFLNFDNGNPIFPLLTLSL